MNWITNPRNYAYTCGCYVIPCQDPGCSGPDSRDCASPWQIVYCRAHRRASKICKGFKPKGYRYIEA